MTSLINAIMIGWQVGRAFLRCPANEVLYFTASCYGVPKISVLLGRGREAWRVSDFAISYNLERRV